MINILLNSAIHWQFGILIFPVFGRCSGNLSKKVGGFASTFPDRVPGKGGPLRSPKPTISVPISPKNKIKDLYIEPY